MEAEDFSRELHKCVALMPNLKFLNIRGNLAPYDGHDVANIENYLGSAKLAQHLRGFCVEIEHEDSDKIIEARLLSPYFEHITYLAVAIGYDKLWPVNTLNGFSKLKDLICIFSA